MNIRQLINAGALFVINHSGGKDSQAMTIRLRKIIPLHQLVIVYAHLPQMAWEGSEEHIRDTCMGIQVKVCQAKKTFMEMVEHRKMFPGMQRRQCTSDLKRGPIEKTIRHISYATGIKLIVNCEGLRADESRQRSNLERFKLSKKNSVAGRTWYDWLPIHSKSEKWVFDTIRKAGQKPHWVYAKGMRRCSCKICIFSSKADIKASASIDPGFADMIASTERRLNFAMIQPKKGEEPKFIDQIINQI